MPTSKQNCDWHARTKAKSTFATTSRVRRGPYAKILPNRTSARKPFLLGATVPSFLGDNFRMLDAASARKRAKSAGISSLVWHARTKAKSTSASASRVRSGPPSTIPFNFTRARNRHLSGTTDPSFLGDDFVGAMPESKQNCDYTTQARRSKSVRLEDQRPKRSSQNGCDVGRHTKHCIEQARYPSRCSIIRVSVPVLVFHAVPSRF